MSGGRGYDLGEGARLISVVRYVRTSKLGGGGIIDRCLVGYCMLGCKTWEKGCGLHVWNTI